MSEPNSALPRMLELTLLFTGLCWLGAATLTAEHAAQGFAGRFALGQAEPLIAAVCAVFLILCGFALLNWIGRRSGSIREANALPVRVTARQEWARGAAVGWGALLAVLLLPMLVGALRPQFWWRPGAWVSSGLALLTAFVGALAIEAGFRGYLLRRAIGSLGAAGGVFLMAVVYALAATLRPNATGLSVFIAFVAALLFSVAYLRTHALWLGWGMRFAWMAASAVLFGLPTSDFLVFNGVVDTQTNGREWLTGGAYGPEAALPALLVFLLAIVVVYRVTRDYAWNYTHPVIVPGGYPMDVPPPAAHSAMEASAAVRPASGSDALVQILPATPGSVSASRVMDTHSDTPSPASGEGGSTEP